MAKPGSFADMAGRALSALVRVATAPKRRTGPSDGPASSKRSVSADARGQARTVEVNPLQVKDLQLSYEPDRDGDPDAGEIVWTWVPYAENDGRGKDRPVLVIARQSPDRVYAVKLTSRSRDGDHEYVSIGTGAWDGERRESWVDLDQLYSVHTSAMRREAAALDRGRFERVAAELRRRFGWQSAS